MTPEEVIRKIVYKCWHLRRDIISDGFDAALRVIQGMIPNMEIIEIASGTECWTWKVPEKWSIRDGWIKRNGIKVVDIDNNPLRIVSYSNPIDKIVGKEELLRHIHYYEHRPEMVPYFAKIYSRDWGFCLSYNEVKQLKEGEYHVYIDSEFTMGKLKIGNIFLQGESPDEIVFVAHLCHPMQCNDNITGVAVACSIAKELMNLKLKTKYSYRFLLVPESIGSIAYLAQNEQNITRIKYAIILETLGHNDVFTLQHSKQGNSEVDKVAKCVLDRTIESYRQGDYLEVIRNDEKVFNSPGVNIPSISISRANYSTSGPFAKSEYLPFGEYHSDRDTIDIVAYERLYESKDLCMKMINVLEHNFYAKRKFIGPIFFAKYGLWPNSESESDIEQILMMQKIQYMLEGDVSALDIAIELNIGFEKVHEFLMKLNSHDLIEILKMKLESGHSR